MPLRLFGGDTLDSHRITANKEFNLTAVNRCVCNRPGNQRSVGMTQKSVYTWIHMEKAKLKLISFSHVSHLPIK